MKLIDVLSNFTTPIVDFPDLNEIIDAKAVLISDWKYRLLQFNHVHTHIIEEFSEINAYDMTEFDKDTYYLLADVVKPSELEDLDPSAYEIGDYIFVYAKEPEKPVEPEQPKLHEGTFNYELTTAEKKAILEKYYEDLEAYEVELEAYNEELDAFNEAEGELKENGFLVQIVDEEHYKVISDVSFVTTKDITQFGIYGKLPKDASTLVTSALGNITEGTSIDGKPVIDIIGKVLGLEKEESFIGKILPDDSGSKARISTLVATPAKVTNSTTPVTLTTTVKIPDGCEVVSATIEGSDDSSNTVNIGSDGEVSTTVTPTETTKYTITIITKKSDDESDTPKTYKSTKTVSVKYEAPAELKLTFVANKTSVEKGNSITLTATPSGGVAPYIVKINNEEVTASGGKYTVSVTPDTAGSVTYSAEVTDGEGTNKTASVDITVTEPAAPAVEEAAYFGNSVWITNIKANFVANDGENNIQLSEVGEDEVREFISNSAPEGCHVEKVTAKGTYDCNTPAPSMPELDNDHPMQQLFIFPASWTATFKQNGANRTAWLTKTLEVDGVNYNIYLDNSVSWNAAGVGGSTVTFA